MKKVAFVLFALLFLISCSDSEFEQNVMNQNESKELVAYPLRKQVTRSSEIVSGNVGEWEKWAKVKLAGKKDSVSTPWNEYYTTGCVPEDIRKDIKYKDGWSLIAHTVNGYGEKGLNYLIFYNRYSGMLKGFYHLDSDANVPNNTGIWKIHFEQPQSFLAFSNMVADLASSKSKSDIYIVNITNANGKAFTGGWNCFQVELSYDPSFTEGSLQIIPMNLSSAKISIDGKLDALTDGTIITTTNSNPLNGVVNAVSSIAGKSAEAWVDNKIKTKKFTSIKNAVINGAGSIVKSGVSSLLGSFIGAFDKNNQTTQTVQLHTNGKVELNGTIQTLQSSTIMPLSISISIKNVGRLGAWCVTESPNVYMDPYAISLGKDKNYPNWFMYQMRSMVDNQQAKVIKINPDLLSEVGPSNVNISYTPYLSDSYEVVDLGNKFSDRYAYASDFNDKLYTDTYRAIDLTYSVSLPFFDKNGNVLEDVDEMLAPYEIFLPDAPGGHKGADPNIRCNSHYKFVYEIQLSLKNGDTVQLCHTVIPKMKWNYGRFVNDKSYLYEYPTIGIGEYVDEY